MRIEDVEASQLNGHLLAVEARRYFDLTHVMERNLILLDSGLSKTLRGLTDNSTLTVTFSRGIPDLPLPFGSDRKLLAWVFDRAINSEFPMIAWESAWEYQKEMGLKL